MRTLGIDLSASPKKTVACVIAWGNGGAVVEELSVDLGDDSLLDKSVAQSVDQASSASAGPAG